MTETRDAEPPVSDETIAEVEGALGHQLPEIYKTFLRKHNGCRFTPTDFESSWYDEEGESLMVMPLDYLFDLREAVKVSKRVQGRIPGSMIAIGQDPGGNLLLMDLHGDSVGAIYYWMLNFEPYGEGGNRSVGTVATDLNAFIESLFDESQY